MYSLSFPNVENVERIFNFVADNSNYSTVCLIGIQWLVGLYLGAAAHLHAASRHFGCTGAHPYIENEYVIYVTTGE